MSPPGCVFACFVLSMFAANICYSVVLRAATRPGTYFDGTAKVTFKATGFGADGDVEAFSTPPETSSGGGSNAASFDVTFFHCKAGTFWKRAHSSQTNSAEYEGTCELCTEDDKNGDIEVCIAMERVG